MAKEPDKDDHGISIALLKQGDSRAFAQFVCRFQDMVFACCRSAGLRGQDIEDVAAETFLAAWRSIGTFNHKCKLGSWLWSIAYHKAVDFRRKHKTDHLPEEALTLLPSTQPAAVEASETRELSAIVWQAVQRLSPPQAAVIVLFYREQKSVDDIAAILQMPQNTVKTHLHRGRKELHSQLQTVWENAYVTK